MKILRTHTSLLFMYTQVSSFLYARINLENPILEWFRVSRYQTIYLHNI